MQNPSATSSQKEFLDNASLHAIDKIKRGRLSSLPPDKRKEGTRVSSDSLHGPLAFDQTRRREPLKTSFLNKWHGSLIPSFF